MMLPILISVSDAPVSYFFCADAAVEKVAASARAAARAPSRTCIAGILISLGPFQCVAFFDWERSFASLLHTLNTLPIRPARKTPRQLSQRARFDRSGAEYSAW